MLVVVLIFLFFNNITKTNKQNSQITNTKTNTKLFQSWVMYCGFSSQKLFLEEIISTCSRLHRCLYLTKQCISLLRQPAQVLPKPCLKKTIKYGKCQTNDFPDWIVCIGILVLVLAHCKGRWLCSDGECRLVWLVMPYMSFHWAKFHGVVWQQS